jgi:hypothetical protein
MKKLFYLFISLLILACTPKSIVDGNKDMGNTMLLNFSGKISMAQFDSMCVADTLPKNLMDWKFLGLKDYESNQRVSLFMYMKRNNKEEIMYRAEDTMDDSVKIIKRLIVE